MSVCDALIEDARRWTMIPGWDTSSPRVDADATFADLERACEGADIAVKACFSPQEGQPGRAAPSVGDVGVALMAFSELARVAVSPESPRRKGLPG